MNGINIRTMNPMDALHAIAKMTYGSGSSEGVKGGEGNIGILNGHVVKFNTHLRERISSTTDDMRASCNQLRLYLKTFAYHALILDNLRDDSPNVLLHKAEVFKTICDDLGVKPDSTKPEVKGLLNRKVVAKVLDTLGTEMGVDVFRGLDEMRTQLSSNGISTRFSTAYKIATNDIVCSRMVDNVLAELAKPAEGRKAFTLTPQETDFMKTLVQRERAALLAAGKPVPSAAEFKQSILSGNSPAFAATMFAFNHSSKALDTFSPIAKSNRMLAVYFSGAPEEERLDRAELFMTACNSLNEVSKTNIPSIAFLRMCEKVKEMRDLQPEGRLSCETIWKTCFDEELPPKLHGQEGSAKFADAINRRTDDLLRSMLKEAVPALGEDEQRLERAADMLNFGGVVLSAAPNLKALMMTALKVVHNNKILSFIPNLNYLFNPSTESLARQSLYLKDDACHHTDAMLNVQMVKDFPRRPMVVRLDNGPGQPPTEIDLRNFKDINVEEHPARVTEFMQQIDAYLGKGNPVQRNVVMLGLTQASIMPLGGMLGEMGDFKSDLIITLSRDQQDSNRVIISFKTAETMAMDAQYAFSVDSDGTNIQHGENIVRPRVMPEA